MKKQIIHEKNTFPWKIEKNEKWRHPCFGVVSMWALLGDTKVFYVFLASPLFEKRIHLLKKESYY